MLILVVSYHRITNGVLEVLKIFQNRAFTCEYKSVPKIFAKRIWYLEFWLYAGNIDLDLEIQIRL